MKLNYNNCEYNINLTDEMMKVSDTEDLLSGRYLLKTEELLMHILACWEDGMLSLDKDELCIKTKLGRSVLKIITNIVDDVFVPFESSDAECDGGNNIDNFIAFRNEFGNNMFGGIASLYIFEKVKTLDEVPRRFLEIQDLLDLYCTEMFNRFEVTSLKNEQVSKSKEFVSLERKLARKEKLVDTKKKEHLKDQEQIEALKKKIKEIKKQETKPSEPSKESAETIKDLEAQIEELKLLKVDKKRFDLANNKLAESLEKYSLMSKTCAELNKELDKFKEWDLYTELSKHLEAEGMSESLMLLLHPYLEDYSNQVKPVCVYKDDRRETRIGYCVIEDDGHYVCFADKGPAKLYNLPEDSYLGQGQFVLVDQDNSYICSLENRYEELSGVEQTKAFIAVHVDEEGNFTNISNPKDYRLRPNQVVAVNSDNEAIHVYKRSIFTADHCLKSALIRGQHVYLVVQKIQDGLLVRDIDSGKNQYLDSIINTHEIGDYSLIFVVDDKVVKYLESPLFYTKSDLYENKRWGNIEILDDVHYINLVNHERLIVHRVIPEYKLVEGDYVSIDEFGNYIMWANCEDHSEMTIEQKIKANNKLSNNSSPKHRDDPIEVGDWEIVIIGDAKLETAYKLAFLREGIDVSVVDGLESWHKVSKAANGADYLVYVTDYAKHSTYNKLKNTYDIDHIIYAEHSGASRVVESVLDVVGA